MKALIEISDVIEWYDGVVVAVGSVDGHPVLVWSVTWDGHGPGDYYVYRKVTPAEASRLTEFLYASGPEKSARWAELIQRLEKPHGEGPFYLVKSDAFERGGEQIEVDRRILGGSARPRLAEPLASQPRSERERIMTWFRNRKS